MNGKRYFVLVSETDADLVAGRPWGPAPDSATARACDEARAVPLLPVLAAQASSRPCRRR
jgi:hypothetical protein